MMQNVEKKVNICSNICFSVKLPVTSFQSPEKGKGARNEKTTEAKAVRLNKKSLLKQAYEICGVSPVSPRECAV